MRQIVAFGHKVQSKQKTKQDRIVNHLLGLSLVHRLITLTHNYTNQVISTTTTNT